MILEPSFLAAGQESKRNIKNLSFLGGVVSYVVEGGSEGGSEEGS